MCLLQISQTVKGNAYKLPNIKLLFNEVPKDSHPTLPVTSMFSEVPKDPHPKLPVTSMSFIYLLELDGKDSIAEDITYLSHSV